MKYRTIIAAFAILAIFAATSITVFASGEMSEDVNASRLSNVGASESEAIPSTKVYPAPDEELLAAKTADEVAEIVWQRFIANPDNLSLSKEKLDSYMALFNSKGYKTMIENFNNFE